MKQAKIEFKLNWMDYCWHKHYGQAPIFFAFRMPHWMAEMYFFTLAIHSMADWRRISREVISGRREGFIDWDTIDSTKY